MPPSLARKARHWNGADTAIYAHFNMTFWKRVDAFGHSRMAAEVERLRVMNQRLHDECDVTGRSLNEPIKEQSQKLFKHNKKLALLSYDVNNAGSESYELCRRLTASNLYSSRLMRERYLKASLWEPLPPRFVVFINIYSFIVLINPEVSSWLWNSLGKAANRLVLYKSVILYQLGYILSKFVKPLETCWAVKSHQYVYQSAKMYFVFVHWN